MMNERLLKQIEFIVEIDKLKHIFRQNILINSSRNENDAEHSWHLAIMAILLSEYSTKKVDILKVIKMVLIHDLVEIDAGDTFCYDEKANEDKLERENKAAARVFGILPDSMGTELYDLWMEFERMETSEAKYAACLDRLEPLLLNYNTEGHTWKKPGVNKAKVLKRNAVMKETAPDLWSFVNEVIEDSVNKGYLKDE